MIEKGFKKFSLNKRGGHDLLYYTATSATRNGIENLKLKRNEFRIPQFKAARHFCLNGGFYPEMEAPIFERIRCDVETYFSDDYIKSENANGYKSIYDDSNYDNEVYYDMLI